MTNASMHRAPSLPAGCFDAAIVGGGLMGAMVAFDLARAGMRAVLLERKPGLCMEASGMNTGALMLQLIRATFIPHALRTIELWRTAPRWLGADMGYVRNGGLAIAFDDDEARMLEGWMDARRAAGAPVEIVSREHARELEPALTDRIRLASYCEVDGFADAKLTGAGFRRGLARARVDVRAPVRVSGIEREEHGFAVIHEGGTVWARRVVLAGGVWLGEMSGWLGTPLPVECRVNQVSVTERMPPILTRSICAATGRLSLKQSPAGTFLVGGGWQGIGSPHEGGYEIIPDHLVANLRMACFTVPAMRGARLLRTWLGLEAKVPDYMPVAGRLPGVEGAYVVGAAHGGYTVGLSIARSLADTILEREPEVPIPDAFDPARFTPERLPEIELWERRDAYGAAMASYTDAIEALPGRRRRALGRERRTQTR